MSLLRFETQAPQASGLWLCWEPEIGVVARTTRLPGLNKFMKGALGWASLQDPNYVSPTPKASIFLECRVKWWKQVAILPVQITTASSKKTHGSWVSARLAIKDFPKEQRLANSVWERLSCHQPAGIEDQFDLLRKDLWGLETKQSEWVILKAVFSCVPSDLLSSLTAGPPNPGQAWQQPRP